MEKIENAVATFLKERSWDNLQPSDLSKSITIEAAELLEVFQWNNHSTEAIKGNTELLKKIQEELADVIIYAVEMAILLNLNTETLVLNKLEKASKKYPAEVMKNNRSNDDVPANAAYYEIKQKSRNNGDTNE